MSETASPSQEIVPPVGLSPSAYADISPRLGSRPLPTIHLRGVPFHAITEAQAIEHILEQLRGGRGGWVITPNLDHLRRLVSDRGLWKLYADASLVVADGMTLVWASRIQGTPLPERVTGSSMINTLSEAAGRQGRSIYLLGGDPGTADQAAGVLQRRYAGLRIAGTDCPEFGFERDPKRLEQVVERVRRATPDIVYVGLGSPKQEWFISQMRGCLPMAWWMGIGISFSFVAGQVVRAPRWMQRTGLEWVHRLAQEPRRLAKRYLVHGLPFGLSLLASAITERMTRRNSVR